MHKRVLCPILRAVLPHLESIDPNWVGVFSSFERGKFEVWVNGPKQGDVSLNELVERSVSAEVLERSHGANVFHFNRQHRLELVIGRTVLHYESGDTGWLVEVNGDELTFGIGFKEMQWKSKRDEVESDLDRFRQSADDEEDLMLRFLHPSYAPFRFTPGCIYEDVVFTSYEQFLKASDEFHRLCNTYQNLPHEEQQERVSSGEYIRAIRAACR